MNSAHLHLVLNHLPIMATLFGLIVLCYGWWIDSQDVLRVALALLFVSGLAVIPVYETGHNAEEIVEDLSGVSHKEVEQHEESAETTYYLMVVLGIVALLGLVQSYRNHSLPGWFLILLGLLGVIALGSLLKTADAGGTIRHPEIEMQQLSSESNHTNNSLPDN
ncbi:MAG: hypothetical protein ABEK50_08965 [bacterium]